MQLLGAAVEVLALPPDSKWYHGTVIKVLGDTKLLVL